MTASSTLSESRTFDSCSVMHALCAHAGVPSPFALRVFLYCGFALYSRIAAFDHSPTKGASGKTKEKYQQVFSRLSHWGSLN